MVTEVRVVVTKGVMAGRGTKVVSEMLVILHILIREVVYAGIFILKSS